MQMINALVETQHESAICNFRPQLQILGESADPLTRPLRDNIFPPTEYVYTTKCYRVWF